MNLSCCIWALSGDEKSVLGALAETGSRWIDVRPFELDASLAELREFALEVSCVAVSHGMPEGAVLNSSDSVQSSKALEYLRSALQFGCDLGAATAYVVPDGGPEIVEGYLDSLVSTAAYAADLGMRLCVEHFPETALPTVEKTLRFLNEAQHPNLLLLFDTGHAQMSDEAAQDSISSADRRLGYVHLDDNDGEEDLHLGLTEGVMTAESLQATFESLKKTGYAGSVSLELSPKLDDPLGSLSRGRELVEPLLT